MLTFGFNELKKTFSVPILADSLIEGTETVRLTLSNPAGGLALGLQATATLSIQESQSVIQFDRLVYQVTEGGMATITVVRSGSVSGVARVAFRTVDGTAKSAPPADYGNRSGVLTFAANATSQTFTVPTVSDDFFEGDQTVTLVLSDPVGALLGQISTATLVITDDDRPGTIGFASDKFTVLESAKTAKITVTRTGGTARDITVQYLTEEHHGDRRRDRDGSGPDYVITSGTLTFGAKETDEDLRCPDHQ